MKRLVLSIMLLAVASVGTACGGGTSPSPSTPINTAPPATETLPPSTDTPQPATPTDVPATPTQAPTPTNQPSTATRVPATATEPASVATETSTPEAQTPSPTTTPAQGSSGRRDGVQVFDSMDCGTCHTLDAAGTSGQVGPELNGIGSRADERIASEEYTGDATTTEGYIRESVLTPNAHVVAGYPENVMPQNFEDRLNDNQLNALVEFLMTQK